MNVDYFIKKFTAIPDELWTIQKYHDPETGACCVMGHCGVRRINDRHLSFTDESQALDKLFLEEDMRPTAVNDLGAKYNSVSGHHHFFTQKTPKARILAALEYIKANEAKL